MLLHFQVVILKFLLIVNYSFAKSQYARCFQRIVRRSIDNSQPIVELFYVTPHQCIDHCIYVTNNNAPRAKLCQSFVYDYLQHSCRLYDHDGKQPPAILHPADGFDYFKRTAILNQCAGPGSPNSSMNFKPSSTSNSSTVYSLKLTSTGTTSQQSQYFLRNPNAVFEPVESLPNPFAAPTPGTFMTSNEISDDDGTSQQTDIIADPVMNIKQSDTTQRNFLPPFGALPQQIGQSLPYQKVEIDENPQLSYKLNGNHSISQQPQILEVPIGYQKIEQNASSLLQHSGIQVPVFIPTSPKDGSIGYKIDNFVPVVEQNLDAGTIPPQLVTTAPALYEELFGSIENNQRTTIAIPAIGNEEETATNIAPVDAIYDDIAQLAGPYLVPTLVPESTIAKSTMIPDTFHDDKRSTMVVPSEQRRTTAPTTEENFPTPAPLLLSTAPRTTTEQPSLFHDIQKGRKQCTLTAYYIVIGYEIVLPISADENSVRLLQNIEQSECARYCTDNIGPKNEPLNCSSLNYFPAFQKCEMYSTLAEPHGSGNLIENDDSIYAEKFCLSATRNVCQEDEIFILHVQKKVNRAAIDIKTANSITGCLHRCLDTRKCKSAGFDSDRRRCYLYDVNVGESPDAVIPADVDWVLIENGCKSTRRRAAARQKNYLAANFITASEFQWSEWSMCQFKQHGRTVRVRSRKCEFDCPDGGMQVEFC